jgi:hypothetical protein
MVKKGRAMHGIWKEHLLIVMTVSIIPKIKFDLEWN